MNRIVEIDKQLAQIEVHISGTKEDHFVVYVTLINDDGIPLSKQSSTLVHMDLVRDNIEFFKREVINVVKMRIEAYKDECDRKIKIKNHYDLIKDLDDHWYSVAAGD